MSRENWERLAEISNHMFGSELIYAETDEGREVVLDMIRYRYERGDYQSCRELGEATVLPGGRSWVADDRADLWWRYGNSPMPGGSWE